MKIVSTDIYLPGIVIPNGVITDKGKWVEESIGIKQRRICPKDEDSSDLGLFAALKLQLRNIDLLIVATTTPSKVAPSTACIIAKNLGLNCPAFDVNAVCCGFIYALSIAETYLRTSNYHNILIIAVDTFSKITDWSERDSVFFGDGAGAVLVTDGNNLLAIGIGGDYSEQGFTCDLNSTFRMNGRLVYETALRLLPESIETVLKAAGLTIDDITYMVPHQPSKRILNDVADKIGLSRDKVLMYMDKYANTTAATIPILLHESWPLFKEGDKILFTAIGSGWTYGSAIYQV